MGLFDNHNHSQFSFDGKKTTVEESAAAAFAKGLDGICFTDHCDFYVPPMKAQFEHLVPEVFNRQGQCRLLCGPAGQQAVQDTKRHRNRTAEEMQGTDQGASREIQIRPGHSICPLYRRH